MQFLIILLVGVIFIWIPQKPLIDWDLYTKGFWSNIPQTYLSNRNFVSPPWGLILLLPYYLIHASGSRVLSVITIGWLAYKREWPFLHFFLVVLSPYFMVTMGKSNMDILVIILPVLLWEYSKGKKLEIIARGISLSVLLLKPQCTFLIAIFLLWTNRKEWKKGLAQLAIVALLVIPISLIGSPPLIFQWLNNIMHPSPQNQLFWSINNISLSAKFGFWIALEILFLTILILFLLVKARIISWTNDQTLASLILLSIFLLPYASQQSLSSGLAFIPSLPGFFVQWLVVRLAFMTIFYINNLSLITLSISLLSLIFYSFLKRRKELKMHSSDRLSQSNS